MRFNRVSFQVSGYGYGDHYIHVKISPPKSLGAEQRALLQAFAELEEDTPGTVNGFTYDRSGKKVVMEDPKGLVGGVRRALREAKEVKEPEEKPKEEENKKDECKA